LYRTVFALVATTLLCASGCAFTTVKPAGPGTYGFRYYEAKPLLIVTATATSVVFIPNPDKAYAVSYYAFLAKHEVTLKMKEGWWFEEVSDKSDPTEFVKGLIALGQEAIKMAAAGAAKAASDPADGKLLGVYEFVFDDSGNIKEMKKLTLPGA
jgi:hypothetical protein